MFVYIDWLGLDKVFLLNTLLYSTSLNKYLNYTKSSIKPSGLFIGWLIENPLKALWGGAEDRRCLKKLQAFRYEFTSVGTDEIRHRKKGSVNLALNCPYKPFLNKSSLNWRSLPAWSVTIGKNPTAFKQLTKDQSIPKAHGLLKIRIKPDHQSIRFYRKNPSGFKTNAPTF